MTQSQRDQDEVRTSVVLDQPQEISSLKSMNSWGKDVTRGIQPRFMYQCTFPNYYEPMEDWEVEENTNINVVEEVNENYLWSSKYAKAQVNVLDEIPESYSHQGNLKLGQTSYTIETWDHEYVDSEMVKVISRVCAFCEEEGHVITDCPFVPFHNKASIVRHVELQNVVGTLMYQP